jgi:CheY-like chemotaxis protein
MSHVSEKRILVVDDEPDVRDFISACLEDAGFQVETAFDGQDALEKIQRKTPDLITLDMIMPRMSGIGLMRKLRDNSKWKEIPVVIITAHAKDEMGEKDIKELYQGEIKPAPKHIIEKPITPTKLVSRIADLLNVNVAIEMTEDRGDLLKAIKTASPEKLKELQKLLHK